MLTVDRMRAGEGLARARRLALPARIVGRTGGEAIALKDEGELPLAELRALHEAWLPHYMGAV